MAFLYNKTIRRFLLALILVWSLVSFWFLNPIELVRWAAGGFGLISFYLIWVEISPLFLLIFISFTASYALYGYFSRYNLPVWLIMIAIMLLFGYLFTFVEQKTGILGNKRLVYLFLFSLVILEVFLALSYFLINPLGQSLIIASVSYVFVGFCFSVLAKRPEEKLSAYFWIAIIAITAALFSSGWGI